MSKFLEFKNRKALKGYLIGTSKRWFDSQGKEFLDENGVDKYPFKYKTTIERIYKHMNEKVSNVSLMSIFNNEVEEMGLVNEVYNIISNKDNYEAWKKSYNNWYYKTYIKTGDEMTRSEIGKMRTDKTRARVKEIINNLSTNGVKITAKAINEATKGSDKVISLATCKRHLKALREESLI